MNTTGKSTAHSPFVHYKMVKEMIARRKEGLSVPLLAEEFGISFQLACKVLRNGAEKYRLLPSIM